MDRRLCTAVNPTPSRDDFVVHLESGDLADGAEHLEDAEAFSPPDVVRGARCASHVGNYVPRDLRHGHLRFAA